MNKKTIDDLVLQNKKVLIRVDFNVPIQDGQITSDKRIIETIPTIKKVINENGKVILLSHLGRITNELDKKQNNLAPIAKKLAEKLGQDVKFIPQTHGKKLEKAILNMKNGEILMLQNTRYEDLEKQKESKNDAKLGKYWASLGDVFINDAFGAVHRSHASNVGIASHIKESAIGYLVQKELKMLSKFLDNPKHPFIAIIGGAKISSKIDVIKNLIQKADKILIAGGMSYTFGLANGNKIGNSLVEKDCLKIAKVFLKQGKDKIVLPLDYVISNVYVDQPGQITKTSDIPNDYMGLDIGPKTIKLFQKNLQGVKTVVWNGPMGVTEFENFKHGTEAIATTIANQKNVFSIIGGGDSAAAIIKLGFANKFTHISTGGGASLQYMAGKSLPGIEVIQNKSKIKNA